MQHTHTPTHTHTHTHTPAHVDGVAQEHALSRGLIVAALARALLCHRQLSCFALWLHIDWRAPDASDCRLLLALHHEPEEHLRELAVPPVHVPLAHGHGHARRQYHRLAAGMLCHQPQRHAPAWCKCSSPSRRPTLPGSCSAVESAGNEHCFTCRGPHGQGAENSECVRRSPASCACSTLTPLHGAEGKSREHGREKEGRGGRVGR